MAGRNYITSLLDANYTSGYLFELIHRVERNKYV